MEKVNFLSPDLLIMSYSELSWMQAIKSLLSNIKVSMAACIIFTSQVISSNSSLKVTVNLISFRIIGEINPSVFSISFLFCVLLQQICLKIFLVAPF